MNDPRKLLIHPDQGAHAPDLDEIWRAAPHAFKCPYCGQQLYPYKDSQAYGIMRCYTTGCPNNPDDPLTLHGNSIHKYDFLAKHRIIRDFKVRRLI